MTFALKAFLIGLVAVMTFLAYCLTTVAIVGIWMPSRWIWQRVRSR